MAPAAPLPDQRYWYSISSRRSAAAASAGTSYPAYAVVDGIASVSSAVGGSAARTCWTKAVKASRDAPVTNSKSRFSPSGVSAASCVAAFARAAGLPRKAGISLPVAPLNSVAERWTRTPCACAVESSAAPGSARGLAMEPLVPTSTEKAMTSVTRSQRKLARSMLCQYGR